MPSVTIPAIYAIVTHGLCVSQSASEEKYYSLSNAGPNAIEYSSSNANPGEHWKPLRPGESILKSKNIGYFVAIRRPDGGEVYNLGSPIRIGETAIKIILYP